MPDLPLYKWLLGAFCAFSGGVAKTGVPGFGIVSVPIFVLTVGDARLSAGYLLPLLVVADIFAVVYYRRHTAAKALFSLLPWVAIGLAAGSVVLGYPDTYIRPLVGFITSAMFVLNLWRWWRPTLQPASGWPTARVYGISAGIATVHDH